MPTSTSGLPVQSIEIDVGVWLKVSMISFERTIYAQGYRNGPLRAGEIAPLDDLFFSVPSGGVIDGLRRPAELDEFDNRRRFPS